MPRRRPPAGGSRLGVTVGGAVLAAGGLVAPSAVAQPGPEPVRLAWVRGHGADGCASQPQIAEQVTARLGRSPFAADAPRAIDAYVSRGERGWRAEIFVRGRDGALAGVRELTSEAPDCAAIEAAGVLALALAIDPDAGLRPAPPRSPAAVSAPPADPSSSSSSPSAPPPALPSPSPSLTVPAPLPAWIPPTSTLEPPVPALGASGVSARAGVAIGLVPGAAAALSLAAQVGLVAPVHLTLDALWVPETRPSDARFGFGLTAFAVGAGVDVVRRARVDFSLRGALWGGALHAVVYALAPLSPGDHPWVAASVAPRLRVRLVSRLHAELGAEALVPLLRPPFMVTGVTAPVFQETPVTLLAGAGLGASFP